MTSTEQPRRVVDLDALAGVIADGLADPTYALDVAVTGNTGDGFVTFDTRVEEYLEPRDLGAPVKVIRATVDLVSDGETSVDGATGEVLEITVRRVPA